MAAGQSSTLRRAASFLALVAFEVGAVVLLAQLGRVPALRIPWHSLMPWLLNSPVEDVLAAVLRMIALLIAWWLLCSNLLYLFASLTRIPSTVRAVRWVTLPVVRSITDHAVALALATSIVGGGAGASIAAATPAVAAAPLRPGAMTSGQDDPHAHGASAFGAAEAIVVRYSPQRAGQSSGGGQQEPQPGQPGYVPKPAGNQPAAQPGSSSSSSSSSATSSSEPSSGSTSTSSSTSSTSSSTSSTSTSTSTSTTRPPTNTTGYLPNPAGPPASTTTSRPPTSTTKPPTSTTRPPAGGGKAPSPTSPQRGEQSTHTVVEGDNLWVISRNRLAQVLQRPASQLSDHEIAAYWMRVIAANQGHLRSGDPDLIFPGEVIQLPPISSS